MFSFARQKRTRKAPATFDAREARPGFHPGPKSGGRRNKIGRCACGTDAFSDFAPAPILKGAYRKRQQGGEKPSPSRLRRATSPERERLWQGRKVCSLTAGFFLPLTNEDETCRFCQGLPLLGELSSGARLRGFFPEAPLSCQATKRGTAGRRGFIPPNTKNARSFHCGRLDFPQGSGQTGENSPIRMRLTKRSRLHPSHRSFPAGPGGSQ